MRSLDSAGWAEIKWLILSRSQTTNADVVKELVKQGGKIVRIFAYWAGSFFVNYRSSKTISGQFLLR
jgi:hypothetical protein